jgi:hypothetical protein
MKDFEQRLKNKTKTFAEKAYENSSNRDEKAMAFMDGAKYVLPLLVKAYEALDTLSKPYEMGSTGWKFQDHNVTKLAGEIKAQIEGWLG